EPIVVRTPRVESFEMLPDWILVRPVAPGKSFIDDGYQRRVGAVPLVKEPAAHQPDTHCLEIFAGHLRPNQGSPGGFRLRRMTFHFPQRMRSRFIQEEKVADAARGRHTWQRSNALQGLLIKPGDQRRRGVAWQPDLDRDELIGLEAR